MKLLAALLLVAFLLIVWWLKHASTRPRKVRWQEPEDGFPATGVDDPRLVPVFTQEMADALFRDPNVRAEILRGQAQIEAGDFVTMDELRAEIRRRVA